MAQALDSICFYCGQAFSLSVMNRIQGGRPCPVCNERLLAALPPLIPGPGSRMAHDSSVGLGQLGEPRSPWGPSDLPEPA